MPSELGNALSPLDQHPPPLPPPDYGEHLVRAMEVVQARIDLSRCRCTQAVSAFSCPWRTRTASVAWHRRRTPHRMHRQYAPEAERATHPSASIPAEDTSP